MKKSATKKKKMSPRKQPPTDLEAQITSAVSSIDDSKTAAFPISHEKLHEFLIDTYKVKYNEVKTVAAKYVDNYDALIVMLQEVYNNIGLSEVKTRITRIINNITTSEDRMDTDDDSSSAFESLDSQENK